MSSLSPFAGVAAQFHDNNGRLLVGGKLYSYLAGTTTLKATYRDSGSATAHTNPIILDSAGRVPGGEIWLMEGVLYDFTVKTSADVLIATYEDIIGMGTMSTLPDSDDIRYLPAGVSAVPSNVQAKLREVISINDFGLSTSSTALQAAITAAAGRTVTITDADNATAIPTSYSTALLEYTGQSATRLFSDTPDGVAKRLLKGQLPLSHSGSRYSVLGVEAQPQGSGLNGPASADCGLTIGVRKKGFAEASRPPTGEIDGLYICVRQDGPIGQPNAGPLSSDASGILVDIQNVNDCGFTSAWESVTSNYNTTSGNVEYSMNIQMGVLIMNASPAPTSYGYVVGANAGALGSAFYAIKAGSGSWDKILDAPGSVLIDKFGAYTAFSIAWPAGSFEIKRTADAANASTQINHRGLGALYLNCAEAGSIQFGTSNTVRWRMNDDGGLYPAADLSGPIGASTLRATTVYAQQLDLGNTSTGCRFITGNGGPEGSVAAPTGSIFLNTAGGASTTLYVKTSGSGNTGWTAK